MAACPSCQQDVDDDFGMVTCPHCGHVFLIDFQGEVETSQSEPSLSDPSASGEEVLYALHEDEEAAGQTSSAITEEEGYDPPLETQGDFQEIVTGEVSSEDLLDIPHEEPDQLETKSFAEEISEFAESPGLAEGAYQYQLKIKVADAQENIQNLRQAIEDLGLGDIGLQRSGPGTMVVGWMGAVSAYRLVHRVRLLGLEIEWDQRHALKESD